MHLHFIVWMMNLLCAVFIFMEQEIWKPVKGFKNYEVSSLGRVKSLDRIVNGKYTNTLLRKGVVLKPNLSSRGYHMVGLYRASLKTETKLVHILVATAFHKKPKYDVQVLHLNDIKTDNRAVNLKWGTGLENMRSAWANGLIRPVFGWERKKSKYSIDVYRNIVNLYNTGKYNRHQISVMAGYPMYCIYSFIESYEKHTELINKLLFDI